MNNEFKVVGSEVIIYVKCQNKTLETMIEYEDLELVKSFPNTWYAEWIQRRGVYVVVGNLGSGISRHRVLLHRWIMKPENNLVVDHIYHNTLDNRRRNLRILTNGENGQNRKGKNKSNFTSKYRGVSFRKDIQKWSAYLTINRKRIHVGTFDTEEEARFASEKARKHFMRFSKEVI